MSAWEPVDGGATLGTEGSERGVILKDEIYAGASQITLERVELRKKSAFVVTCGIGGWMVHTHFMRRDVQQAESDYERMKARLAEIVDGIPPAEPEPASGAMNAVTDRIARFVAEFP